MELQQKEKTMTTKLSLEDREFMVRVADAAQQCLVDRAKELIAEATALGAYAVDDRSCKQAGKNRDARNYFAPEFHHLECTQEHWRVMKAWGLLFNARGTSTRIEAAEHRAAGRILYRCRWVPIERVPVEDGGTMVTNPANAAWIAATVEAFRVEDDYALRAIYGA